MTKTVILVALLLSAFVSLSGETESLRFQHLTLADGLSQNSVFCILQDSKGFLWFGTQDGLNKYDGYSFTVYKWEPGNPDSISHNQISCLAEDPEGNIWIGTRNGGLNRMETDTGRITRYIFSTNPDHLSPDSLMSANVRSLAVGPDKELWVGTTVGLSCLKNGRFTHLRSVDPKGLDAEFVVCVYIDRVGVLWVGTSNGLRKFNRNTGTFTAYRFDAHNPRGLNSPRVNVIYEDRVGMFWIGTISGGLSLMDRNDGTFQHYTHHPQKENSISSNDVVKIIEDRAGVLWVGTFRDGLNRFDKRSETFIRYKHNPSVPHSLSDDFTTALYEDRSRVLWVGTPGKGLNKFNREDRFNHHASAPDNDRSISGSFVYSLFEDHLGYLWVGYRDRGVDQLDRAGRTIKNYMPVPGNPDSLGSDYIRCMVEDRNNHLWLGSGGSGVDRFNRESGTFTHFKNNPQQPTGLSGNFINTLYLDQAGVLWIGTFNGGLERFHHETGTFTHYTNNHDDDQSINSNNISVIFQSPSEPGKLWLGTSDSGINHFDIQQGTSVRYSADENDETALSFNSIHAILESRDRTLWVATYGGGLNKVLRNFGSTLQFKRYTEKNGLSNNSVYGLLEDDDGNIWCSTNKGLSRLNPGTEEFRNYSAADGLQSNEFNSGAFHKSKNGEMFFGGINGFNAFFPQRIKDNPHVPPVVLTDFKLRNKTMDIGPESPLIRKISYTEKIRLTHKQNNFSLQFAALDYTIPNKHQYAYRMEGFEDQWTYVGSQQRNAVYTNIPPGTYRFRVKGSNNDGVWNQIGTTLDIIITPPYWQTWWFLILVLLLTTQLLRLGYRKRLKTVGLKTELRTAQQAQMSIMPQQDPQIDGYEISGICIPAREVGGDFFDYIWLDPEKTRLGIAVGDVSGKAMKSAMTAVMTSGMIYLKAGETNSVSEIMQQVNGPLYMKTNKRVFTALCLASIDLTQRILIFTNAGLHPPLLKCGTTGAVSLLQGNGDKFPLGIRKHTHYQEKTYPLDSGDLLFFFTDGITEAKNAAGEFFSLENFRSLLEKTDCTTLTAAQIKEGIISAVKHFAVGAQQHDDITMVVVKIK